MNRHFLLLVLSASLASAEPPLRDEPLADVKASLQIPADWKVTSESEDGVFVYHLVRLAKTGESDGHPITLSVTTKVPERAEQSPAEYAAALLDMSQDDGPAAPVQKVEVGGLPALRTEYQFDGDAGKMRAVNVAVPNDKTGTLYFFAWQAPLDEPLEFEALREKVVVSAKLDPGF